tara:strand:- start:1296 stop:1619 length:324 start_codon:yes stop_codon:yes gene_type:complete
MKRLLAGLALGFGLGILTKGFTLGVAKEYNVFLESISDASLSILCRAHSLRYISGVDLVTMAEGIHKKHIDSYVGTKYEANEVFKEVIYRSLEAYPECHIKVFSPVP